MPFDLKLVEGLAPDQSSLSAAAKLTKRANWVKLARKGKLLWGECQGSGANPYRVAADGDDVGSKCTCPSRKFPCKHALALMWIAASAPGEFVDSPDAPEWVQDWLGRRRGGVTKPTAGEPKSIAEAERPAPTAPEDPAAVERREAARRKREDSSRAAVAAGLDEFDAWVSDQLRLGLAGFVDAASERCRRIAARLVDAKAGGLASRIDELPAHLLALRSEERPEAALRELGKLVLLATAWRAAPDDPELARLVGASETREEVLADPAALRVEGVWEALGERIETRRDGLVSHATWLMQTDAEATRFALLQDFYPASAGRRSQAFTAGEQFAAELVFYPAQAPLRALVARRSEAMPASVWPEYADDPADPLAAHVLRQRAAPWSALSPLRLPQGGLARDERGRTWWRAGTAPEIALPLAKEPPEAALGLELAAAFGLWNGARLDLLVAASVQGRLDF